MEEKERSVVERLEDIENKIPTPQKPVFIDDIIGMPFSSYLKQSTVYGVEEDERKFKHSIKRQTVMPIICLCILLAGIVVHAIALSINKGNEWMVLVGDFLAALCPVMALLILGNQKSKQPMKSFWNIKNKEFYLVPEGDHKKISSETKNGFWFYAMLFGKIISIVGCAALTFIYFATSMQTSANGAMYWLSSVFGYLALLTCVIVSKFGPPYYFFHYIFETEDSYVTYPNLDYVKKDK